MHFLFRFILIQSFLTIAGLAGVYLLYGTKDPTTLKAWQNKALKELQFVGEWTDRLDSGGDIREICKKQSITVYRCFYSYTKGEKSFEKMSWIGLSVLWLKGFTVIMSSGQIETKLGAQQGMPTEKRSQVDHWTNFIANDLKYLSKLPKPREVIADAKRLISSPPIPEREVSAEPAAESVTESMVETMEEPTSEPAVNLDNAEQQD